MTSQINPNNIDASYPVAGQPNNTQGFRDNFTAIQTNFQAAENEINDLQSKAVLKAALTGTTLDNNMNDALIYAAKIQDFSATSVAITATAGSIVVDYSAGHYQTISTTGNINVSIGNFPTAPAFGYIKLQLVIDAPGRTVTFSGMTTLYGTTGVQGMTGNTITFAATGTYEFAFQTNSGGVTVTMFDLNRPLSYYTNSVTIAGSLSVSGNIIGNVVTTTQTFTGNLTGGNLLTAGYVTATGNVVGGNVVTTGNINGLYFIGDGSQLTGITVSSGTAITNGSSNVRVSANSNVTVGVSGTPNVVQWSNSGEYVTGLISATGNITGGNLSTNGNIIAGGYILGNGALLTGVAASTNIVSGTTQMAIELPSGNIQATIGGTANVMVITTAGLGIAGYVAATGNLVGSNVSTTGLITATGNVTGGNLRTGGLISAAGNITSGNVAVTGNVSLTANVIAGNLTTGSQVVALGNVTGGNIRTDGQVLAMSATAVPAGGAAGAGVMFSTTANFGVFFGSGVPTLSAAKGSLYLRSDGSTTNDRMYVNTNGTTGWTAVTTAS